MILRRREPIVRATAWLAVVWTSGLILTHFSEFDLAVALWRGYMAGAGALIGISASLYALLWRRTSARQRTAPSATRGVRATIGPIPLHKLEPPAADDLPSDDRVASIPEVSNAGAGDFFRRWLAELDRTSAAHTALVRKLARLLNFRPQLRAGYGEDGYHGDRTLLQHCLLVTHLMLREAPRWEYRGLLYRSGAVALPLKDPGYRFNSSDPMIGIVALAHDIGKLECFRFAPGDDQRIDPIECTKDHDLVGAQLLARLPETWALPDPDRELLFLVVGHYHHLEAMPLEAPRTAISDRLHAIAELLAKIDDVASKMEREGVSFTQAKTETEQLSSAATERMRVRLFEHLATLLQEAGRINGPDQEFNVGFKLYHPRYHRHLLFLHEPNLLRILPQRARMEEFNTGIVKGVVSPFSKALLITLNEHGVLVADADGQVRGVEAAIFSSAFYRRRDYMTKKPDGTEQARESLNAQLARYKLLRTIVVRCEGPFAWAKDLPDFVLIPHVTGTPFGARGISRKRKGVLDASVEKRLDLTAELGVGAVQANVSTDEPVIGPASSPMATQITEAEQQPRSLQEGRAVLEAGQPINEAELGLEGGESLPQELSSAPVEPVASRKLDKRSTRRSKSKKEPQPMAPKRVATHIVATVRTLPQRPPMNAQGFYVIEDAARTLSSIPEIEAKLELIEEGGVPGMKAKRIDGLGIVVGIDRRLLHFET